MAGCHAIHKLQPHRQDYKTSDSGTSLASECIKFILCPPTPSSNPPTKPPHWKLWQRIRCCHPGTKRVCMYIAFLQYHNITFKFDVFGLFVRREETTQPKVHMCAHRSCRWNAATGQGVEKIWWVVLMWTCPMTIHASWIPLPNLSHFSSLHQRLDTAPLHAALVQKRSNGFVGATKDSPNHPSDSDAPAVSASQWPFILGARHQKCQLLSQYDSTPSSKLRN